MIPDERYRNLDPDGGYDDENEVSILVFAVFSLIFFEFL